ncbi:hypothetical protein [Halomicronema sp. CCY15110]|uniref:hypothetical protein n=1 Tax=Halomicronema sp. CCY15110 TaxID=2767773 RepID=UPI00194F8665|nr:hypothetical protein [Halomicronema sp. CCY15110]
MGGAQGALHPRNRDRPRVGAESQSIVEVSENSVRKTHLEFGDRCQADAMFSLQPEDGKTHIIWSPDADMRDGVSTLQQPISTYGGFFMDARIDREYETGLKKLKALIKETT